MVAHGMIFRVELHRVYLLDMDRRIEKMERLRARKEVAGAVRAVLISGCALYDRRYFGLCPDLIVEASAADAEVLAQVRDRLATTTLWAAADRPPLAQQVLVGSQFLSDIATAFREKKSLGTRKRSGVTCLMQRKLYLAEEKKKAQLAEEKEKLELAKIDAFGYIDLDSPKSKAEEERKEGDGGGRRGKQEKVEMEGEEEEVAQLSQKRARLRSFAELFKAEARGGRKGEKRGNAASAT